MSLPGKPDFDYATWQVYYPMYPGCPLKADVCKHCILGPWREKYCIPKKLRLKSEESTPEGY